MAPSFITERKKICVVWYLRSLIASLHNQLIDDIYFNMRFLISLLSLLAVSIGAQGAQVDNSSLITNLPDYVFEKQVNGSSDPDAISDSIAFSSFISMLLSFHEEEPASVERFIGRFLGLSKMQSSRLLAYVQQTQSNYLNSRQEFRARAFCNVNSETEVFRRLYDQRHHRREYYQNALQNVEKAIDPETMERVVGFLRTEYKKFMSIGEFNYESLFAYRGIDALSKARSFCVTTELK